MNLENACDELEKRFGAVDVADALLAPAVLCTGAMGLQGEPPPVICATPDLAVALWLRTAIDYAMDCAAALTKDADAELGRTTFLKNRCRLTWMQEPQLLLFRMTIQDHMGAQRIATTRYAVYSLCAISELPQDVAGKGAPDRGGSRSNARAGKRAERTRKGRKAKS